MTAKHITANALAKDYVLIKAQGLYDSFYLDLDNTVIDILIVNLIAVLFCGALPVKSVLFPIQRIRLIKPG